jgi:hypothetical protein
VAQDIEPKVLDESVGLVAVGSVRPDDEPTDTDSIIRLDNVGGYCAWGGNRDLERTQHGWSRLCFNQLVQLSDQLASPVDRSEPAEPPIADAGRSGKGCHGVTSDHDWRVWILHWCRELSDLMTHAAVATGAGSCPKVTHRGQTLVGSTSSFGHRHAKGSQLGFDMADTDTDDQAPL